MSHPAAPPGSACLPLDRRLHPVNTLKLWPIVLSNHFLHRHPFAPTPAGATLIAQRIHYVADVIKRCCMNISCPWEGYLGTLKNVLS